MFIIGTNHRLFIVHGMYPVSNASFQKLFEFYFVVALAMDFHIRIFSIDLSDNEQTVPKLPLITDNVIVLELSQGAHFFTSEFGID